MLKEKFEKIYNELINKNNKELTEAREKVIEQSNKHSFISIFIVLGGAILLVILALILSKTNLDEETSFILSFFLILCICLIILYFYFKKDKDDNIDKDETKSYGEVFDEKFIRPMIKSISETLEYDPNDSISVYTFKETKPKPFDNFKSEKLIYGSINKNQIKISHIAAFKDSYDYSMDRSGTAVIFSGILIDIGLQKNNNYKLYLKCKGDLEERLISVLDSKKVILEDDVVNKKIGYKEFDKEFKIYTSNEDWAKQILSIDLMKKILEYYKQIKNDFDIIIKNNHIYITVSCGDIFSPIPYTYKNELYHTYEILNFIFEISNLLTEIV